MMSNILFLFDANTSRVPGYAPFFGLIGGAHLFDVYFAMFCFFVLIGGGSVLVSILRCFVCLSLS